MQKTFSWEAVRLMGSPQAWPESVGRLEVRAAAWLKAGKPVISFSLTVNHASRSVMFVVTNASSARMSQFMKSYFFKSFLYMHNTLSDYWSTEFWWLYICKLTALLDKRWKDYSCNSLLASQSESQSQPFLFTLIDVTNQQRACHPLRI